MPRPQNETSLNAIRVLFEGFVVYPVGSRLGIQEIIKIESMYHFQNKKLGQN